MERIVINNAKNCERCGLCTSRTQVVFGQGTTTRGIMLIGEAPGRDEDAKGIPFIGQAGKMLKRWMAHIGLSRKRDYYVTNLVKCKPPNNRAPSPEEIRTCNRWLSRELNKVKPWLIITLGSTAAKTVLDDEGFAITREGGKIHPRVLAHLGYHTTDFVMVVPLLHPNYILRNLNDEDHVLDQLTWLKENVLSKAPDAA